MDILLEVQLNIDVVSDMVFVLDFCAIRFEKKLHVVALSRVTLENDALCVWDRYELFGIYNQQFSDLFDRDDLLEFDVDRKCFQVCSV